MNNDDIIDKIKGVYSDFTLKIDRLFTKRKELFKTYRQKLEEAKIQEVKDSILKQ